MKFGGEIIFDPCIGFDDARFMMDQQLSGEIESFQCDARHARIAPIPGNLFLEREVFGSDKSLLIDNAMDFRSDEVEIGDSAEIRLKRAPDPVKFRPVFERINREILIEMIDEDPVDVQELGQHRFLVAGNPRLQDKVGVFAACVDGVKLHATRLANVV